MNTAVKNCTLSLYNVDNRNLIISANTDKPITIIIKFLVVNSLR